MKKEIQQRAISMLAGLCAVLLIGIAVTGQREKCASDKLRAGYENSLYNTLDGISSIYNDLCKASFCNEREYLRRLYGQISARAGNASARVGELPISQESIQKTEQLLNHVSDYCGFLALKDERLPDEEENVRALRDSCGRLYSALGDISAVVGSGQDVFADDVLSDTDIAWQQAESDSVNYPTLIYDGPFSQGEKIGKPKTQRERVSKQAARQRAKVLLGECEDEGENEGNIPCYVFANGGKNAAYTKEGGLLLWYLDSREQKGEEISDEDARKEASEFLVLVGYEGFESVFASKGKDSIIFNFAPSLNGTVIYPDLVKVRVSLVGGAVTGFEGSSYVVCNHQRQLEQAGISRQEAQGKLSGLLSVQSSRLSVIPNGNSEALAWEFYCMYGNDKYIVYIDAINARQLQMYRIIPTENGDMVI